MCNYDNCYVGNDKDLEKYEDQLRTELEKTHPHYFKPGSQKRRGSVPESEILKFTSHRRGSTTPLKNPISVRAISK